MQAAGHQVIHNVVVVGHGIEDAADKAGFFIGGDVFFAKLDTFWILHTISLFSFLRVLRYFVICVSIYAAFLMSCTHKKQNDDICPMASLFKSW